MDVIPTFQEESNNGYISFYNEVKSNLERFLKEYFNVDGFQDPQNVAFYDRKEVYNVRGETSKDEAEEFLEDYLGVYIIGETVVVRVKDNLEKTLVHELLHHVGKKVDDLRVLLDNEYLTQLLTNAYIKWRHPEYTADDNLDEDMDVIEIYLNDYGIADSDARGLSADEIVSLFKSKTSCDDCIPITLDL